jgi:hypothetical protein
MEDEADEVGAGFGRWGEGRAEARETAVGDDSEGGEEEGVFGLG